MRYGVIIKNPAFYAGFFLLNIISILSSTLSIILYMDYRQYLILIIFLFSSCSNFKNVNIKDYESNHYIKSTYYENGQLEYESSYLNNILDGPTSYWNAEGQLQSYAEYSNGKPHGKWQIYFTSGQLKYEALYSHGKLNGKEIYYYSNGQTKTLNIYEYGEKKGDTIRWDENGEMIY